MAVIHPPGGRAFRIEASGASSGKQYIQAATLNGKPLTRTWISHQEIVEGGLLVFQMGPQPNPQWGSGPEDAPPSMSTKP